MAITEKDIIHAAESLTMEGINPTMERIREKLDGGSYTTISPYLRKWKNEQKNNNKLLFDMPEKIPELGKKLATDLWLETLEITGQKANELHSKLDSLEIEYQTNEKDYLSEISRLEKEIEMCIKTQENAQGEIGIFQQKITDQKIHIGTLQSEAATLQKTISELKDELKISRENEMKAQKSASAAEGQLEKSREFHKEQKATIEKLEVEIETLKK